RARQKERQHGAERRPDDDDDRPADHAEDRSRPDREQRRRHERRDTDGVHQRVDDVAEYAEVTDPRLERREPSGDGEETEGEEEGDQRGNGDDRFDVRFSHRGDSTASRTWSILP